MILPSAGPATGSSPRMRGTRVHCYCHCACAGIIPAYAGNTSIGNPLPSGNGDHPRVCGEHKPQTAYEGEPLGSSPRMRGTPVIPTRTTRLTRIIPAYAGNTWRSSRWACRPRDHPRVCGEHLPFSRWVSIQPGSSPRMRGTHGSSSLVSFLLGIIPAYAGNTKSVSVWSSCGWDHPRVCGEHPIRRDRRGQRGGSSPRMRGTRVGVLQCGDRGGIIPAYAGNTRCRLPRAARWWDHPRVCGEHTKRL